jgi:hypothetical protein
LPDWEYTENTNEISLDDEFEDAGIDIEGDVIQDCELLAARHSHNGTGKSEGPMILGTEFRIAHVYDWSSYAHLIPDRSVD